MLYKGKTWQDSGILWHTLAYSGILWHILAYSGILWHNQCIINNCWRSGPLPFGQYMAIYIFSIFAQQNPYSSFLIFAQHKLDLLLSFPYLYNRTLVYHYQYLPNTDLISYYRSHISTTQTEFIIIICSICPIQI